MVFRLKALEPTEKQISNSILDALSTEASQGRVSWYGRFNCGRLWVPPNREKTGWYWSITYWIKGRKRKKGFSDIAGMLTDGRFFTFEVKVPSAKKGTDEQHDFLDHSLGHGAIGGMVRSADEAIEIIRGAFSEG